VQDEKTPENLNQKDQEKIIEAEDDKLLQKLKDSQYVIALDLGENSTPQKSLPRRSRPFKSQARSM
jgi:23S rRNA pseudoU1915 N3-methylase RlmH